MFFFLFFEYVPTESFWQHFPDLDLSFSNQLIQRFRVLIQLSLGLAEQQQLPIGAAGVSPCLACRSSVSSNCDAASSVRTCHKEWTLMQSEPVDLGYYLLLFATVDVSFSDL